MHPTTKMMKELTEIPGVPGFEREVRTKMEEYLRPVTDRILTDRLGSIIGMKAGDPNGPRILLAGHLDEIGFMITQITKKGFLHFQPLGGWWPHNLLSHRVTVRTRKGDYLGIVGSKAPHILTADERKKVLSPGDMFIDVGARNKEEAENMGIRPGDPVAPVSEFFTMRNGELWGGKALDNRAGCALAIEVLKRLGGEPHPNIVYSGATVQEEVGLRGATTVANLVQPDIAFALDVGIAYDSPGLESFSAKADIGEGPLLMLMDYTMIPHVGLRDLMIQTADELGIRLQYDALMQGGTDGGKFHLSGVGCPTVAIGFPARYIHSHNAIMSKSDFEQAAELLVAVIKKLDHKTVKSLLI